MPENAKNGAKKINNVIQKNMSENNGSFNFNCILNNHC